MCHLSGRCRSPHSSPRDRSSLKQIHLLAVKVNENLHHMKIAANTSAAAIETKTYLEKLSSSF